MSKKNSIEDCKAIKRIFSPLFVFISFCRSPSAPLHNSQPHKQMQISPKTLHNVTRTELAWMALKGGLINLSIEAMGPLGIFSPSFSAQKWKKGIRPPLSVRRGVRLIQPFMLTLLNVIPRGWAESITRSFLTVVKCAAVQRRPKIYSNIRSGFGLRVFSS